MDQEQGFYWERHAGAEQVCLDALAECRRGNATLARFEARLREQASGRLLDWADHLLLPPSGQVRGRLSAAGFVREPASGPEAWWHPGALLPRIVLTDDGATGVALRVESLADFLQANGFRAGIEGEPFAPYRRALVMGRPGAVLLAVERRGRRTYEPATPAAGYLENYFAAIETWQTRPRAGEDEAAILDEAGRRAEQIIALLGTELAAHVVCRGERTFWLARNRAGRVQKGRQDTLGLGWGNHDHYTFRSSRQHFSRLVSLFSRLGFRNRERFYAGEEAGWGAQVMENEAAGLTLFLDVDLAPEEVATDFTLEELPPREQLGTVGLWCALHGDSILGAGLHHLAGRFDFNRLTADLAGHGIEYMPPFSDFSYLRQAFSVAERWAVDPQRVARLVAEKMIGSEQGEKFLAGGAVGSHLENIERGEGYKGFNRKNVSAIIRATDPRREGLGTESTG